MRGGRQRYSTTPTILDKNMNPDRSFISHNAIVLFSFFPDNSNIFFFKITGPYGINGVPLRRVNQRYVIATNTKVDVAGVDVSKIDDALFAREDSEDSKEDMEKLFASGESKPTYTSAIRKSTQTTVDTALTKNIEKVEMLSAYMKAKFSLSKGDLPHLMKF